MNITIIAEVLGEPNNGTSIATYNLVNYLKEKGHHVKVVCPDKDKQGIPDYYVLPQINLGPVINRLIEKNNVILPKFDEHIINEACKDADLVHIMMPLFISKKTSKYVKDILKKPLTAGFHAQAENFTSNIGLLKSSIANHLVYRWYFNNLYSRVDGIHYPTQFIKDYFEREIGSSTNGYVISNGVHSSIHKEKIEKPEEYKDKFCILYTGRLSKEKNHMVLLKAISRSKYNDKIQLFLAGQGPLKTRLEKYAKNHLKNKAIIKFYTHDELNTLINQMDLYVHPSIVEIEAISCLEAISCGLVPLIADSSKSATRKFAIDRRCLFNPNDEKDLSAKIDYMIEHPRIKELFSNEYSETFNNQSSDSCMKEMEKMFFNVIKKTSKTRKIK